MRHADLDVTHEEDEAMQKIASVFRPHVWPEIKPEASAIPPGIERLISDYEKLINIQRGNIRVLTKSLRVFVGRDRLINHADNCTCDWCKAVELCDEMERAE